ncbi:MAG: nucleotidyltransferase domain-containing protein [Burkholderiales bacterium]
MRAEIDSRRREIADLCRRFGVRRLELFGSGALEDSRAALADLDFLVDLGEPPPPAYADAYFGLRESLEALFGRPVDLVTAPSVLNRYFREGIDRARQLLYAA